MVFSEGSREESVSCHSVSKGLPHSLACGSVLLHNQPHCIFRTILLWSNFPLTIPGKVSMGRTCILRLSPPKWSRINFPSQGSWLTFARCLLPRNTNLYMDIFWRPLLSPSCTELSRSQCPLSFKLPWVSITFTYFQSPCCYWLILNYASCTTTGLYPISLLLYFSFLKVSILIHLLHLTSQTG